MPDLGGALPWRIVSADPAIDLELEGQYAPDGGMTEQRPAAITGTAAPGTSAPVVQWVAQGVRQVGFRAVFCAANWKEDVQAELELLRRLESVDHLLGRGPRVILEWGGAYAIRGFTAVDIRVSAVWRQTGRPRIVEADIKITEALPVDVTAEATTGETQWKVLSEGESFELVALGAYGDPLKGEFLRRANPESATGEEGGDLIKAVEAWHPSVQGKPRPAAHCYQGDGWEAEISALAQELLERRQSTRAWETLEDVISGAVEL